MNSVYYFSLLKSIPNQKSQKEVKMDYQELTHKIIGCAYSVFNQLARPPRLSELLG
jgi:hypothetical protein